MRKAFASICVVFALSASCAHANDYVCELSLVPPVVSPTMGNSGYVEFFTSTEPHCAGAETQRFLCSKGATNKLCGVDAQYSEASLLSIYETMRSSEVTQQPIVPYWNACINAGGGCVGGVLLYPDF
jgi:hypothetical protein